MSNGLSGSSSSIQFSLNKVEPKLNKKTKGNENYKKHKWSSGSVTCTVALLFTMKSLARKPNEKLSPQFYGPYKVIQRIGELQVQSEKVMQSRISNDGCYNYVYLLSSFYV